MENKINIAEILKDCPKGTKLYSPIFGEVYLDKIRPHLAIVVTTDKEQGDFKEEFLYDGKYGTNGECMLFPSKDQRDWGKFQRPFKDGDIISNGLYVAIFHKTGKPENCVKSNVVYYHCWYNKKHIYNKFKAKKDFGIGIIKEYKYATEEEKSKLFQAIKDNGYKWNAETKTLEKLSKFKVGDKIQHKDGGIHCTLGKYVEAFNGYRTNIGLVISYDDIDNWELAPDKFDINTLKPFDKVLVRFNSLDCWHIQYFEKYDKGEQKYHFICLCECKYEQCIPYEENKHLLNTTNNCDNYYKTWE